MEILRDIPERSLREVQKGTPEVISKKNPERNSRRIFATTSERYSERKSCEYLWIDQGRNSTRDSGEQLKPKEEMLERNSVKSS